MPWGGFKPLHLGAASSDGDHYTICCSFCTLISVDVVNWDNNLKILLLSECAKIKQTQWLAIIALSELGLLSNVQIMQTNLENLLLVTQFRNVFFHKVYDA